jgi:hypothetical protein
MALNSIQEESSSNYKVVSLDVFGTLIDLPNLVDSFWKALDNSIPAEALSMYQLASAEIFLGKFEYDSGRIDSRYPKSHSDCKH